MKPFKIKTIRDCQAELMSAMSALNMRPETFDGKGKYISEIEPMAEHAMLHIKNVWSSLNLFTDWNNKDVYLIYAGEIMCGIYRKEIDAFKEVKRLNGEGIRIYYYKKERIK